jgi:hypothetical protein
MGTARWSDQSILWGDPLPPAGGQGTLIGSTLEEEEAALVLRGCLIVALLSLAACGTGSRGSVAPAVAEVHGAPTEVLATLPDGRLMVEQEGRLLGIDPRRLDLGAVVIGASEGVGEVRAAVAIDGASLILASEGAFVLRDSAWVPSPLPDALDGPIRAAVMLPSVGTGAGELWVATDRSLFRVFDDRVEALALDEPLADAELAIVERPEGAALWVRLADRVLEVWRDRTGVVRSASLVLPFAPEAIAGDAAGTGWLVLDGRLHSIGADRALVDHGIDAARLLGARSSDELWIFPPEGAPILHADGAFFDASGVGAGASDRLALGADGSLYVAGASVRRYAPRHDVVVGGVAEGSLVVTPVTFTIEAPGAPTIEAAVDGAPVEAIDGQIELEPSALGDGAHELVIRVGYEDGTLAVEERRRFEVLTSATWSADVEPLYTAHCAACHGAAGPANTRLDTREAWMSLSAIILTNVREQRMPLNRPPLTQREIAQIEIWTLSGYAE